MKQGNMQKKVLFSIVAKTLFSFILEVLFPWGGGGKWWRIVGGNKGSEFQILVEC